MEDAKESSGDSSGKKQVAKAFLPHNVSEELKNEGDDTPILRNGPLRSVMGLYPTRDQSEEPSLIAPLDLGGVNECAEIPVELQNPLKTPYVFSMSPKGAKKEGSVPIKRFSAKRIVAFEFDKK